MYCLFIVVQLSSMSQHYLLADASGSTYNRVQALSLILSTLCTLVITRDKF